MRRTDRDPILIIVITGILFFIIYQNIDKLLGTDDNEQTEVAALLKKKHYAEKKSPLYYAVPEEEPEFFDFDPNTADSTELLRLGLRPWQVRNIYRYRAAGGRYRKPSDFARLYGLEAELYQHLLPHIKIKEIPMAADIYGSEPEHQTNRYDHASTMDTLRKGDGNSSLHNHIADKSGNYPDSLYPRKVKPGEYININTADTTMLKKIPGIGSYYAKRIVWRRQQLGGFYSPSQLIEEIENFPEHSLPYITVGERDAKGNLPGVTYIHINRLNAKQLSRHPYIRYVQAKQIEEYRRNNGRITSANTLMNLPSFNAADIRKLSNYLSFE